MRSIYVLVAAFALVSGGGCDQLSHPFDDPHADTLPNVNDYDRSCTTDSDCTAVNGGDCGCPHAVGINVNDAARFEMDFSTAQNGSACAHFDGPFCSSPQEGTITPTCSSGQCIAVFCDFNNVCSSN